MGKRNFYSLSDVACCIKNSHIFSLFPSVFFPSLNVESNQSRNSTVEISFFIASVVIFFSFVVVSYMVSSFHSVTLNQNVLNEYFVFILLISFNFQQAALRDPKKKNVLLRLHNSKRIRNYSTQHQRVTERYRTKK